LKEPASWWLSVRPYLVAYAVIEGQLNMLAVQHGAQEWPQRF
jgi:hypothetical protein